MHLVEDIISSGYQEVSGHRHREELITEVRQKDACYSGSENEEMLNG